MSLRDQIRVSRTFSAVGARHLSFCVACQLKLYVELTGSLPPLNDGWKSLKSQPGVHWKGKPMSFPGIKVGEHDPAITR